MVLQEQLLERPLVKAMAGRLAEVGRLAMLGELVE